MTATNIRDLTEHQRDLDNMNDIDSIVSKPLEDGLQPDAQSVALDPEALMSRTSFEIEDFSGTSPDNLNSANTFDNDRQSISSRLSRALTKESNKKTSLEDTQNMDKASQHPTDVENKTGSTAFKINANPEKKPGALQTLIQRFKALFV